MGASKMNFVCFGAFASKERPCEGSSSNGTVVFEMSRLVEDSGVVEFVIP